MSDNHIEKLTDTLHAFIKENAGATARLEVQQQHLAVSVQKVAEASEKAILSNSKLEERIVSLEQRAIDKLNLVEDTVNENSDEIEVVKGRVSTLELLNANKAGVEEGKEEVNKKFTGRWTKALGLTGAVVAVVGLYIKLNTGT